MEKLYQELVTYITLFPLFSPPLGGLIKFQADLRRGLSEGGLNRERGLNNFFQF